MSCRRMEIELPQAPRRVEYAPRVADRVNLSRVGRDYRKKAKQAVRGAGRITFKPTRLSIIVHDTVGVRADLSEVGWVVSDAFRQASAMVAISQLDQIEVRRGELKTVAGLVVVLEGES